MTTRHVDDVAGRAEAVTVTPYVDLAAETSPQGVRGLCVVLPGRQYSPDAPLLFFAAQVALARGWHVRQVWWDPAARGALEVEDEAVWVGEQLRAAAEGYDGRLVVVAKSLGTLAAPVAADLGCPAAWLTPLLTEPLVSEALLAYPAPQLTAIGESDPYLDRTVLAALGGRTVLVPGDHVLRVPGDPGAMLAAHTEVTLALDAWLRDR